MRCWPTVLRARGNVWFPAVIAIVSSLTLGSLTAHADKEYMLSVGAGQTQTAQVQTPFATQMSATVCVNGSFPCIFVSGVSVTFTAPSTGASGTFATTGTTSVTVVSDSNGQATAPVFTANGTAGTYTVSAVETEPDCGIDPNGSTNPQWCVSLATFALTNSLTAVTKPTEISQGDGSLQSARVGATYTSPLSAIVFIDGASTPPVFAPGMTVTFSAPSSGPSVVFGGTGTNVVSVVTGATGVATTPPMFANLQSGQFEVDATVPGSETQSGQALRATFFLTNSTTNLNGVPVIVSVAAGGGQNVGTLTAFPTDMAVVVLDGSLHPVQNAEVDFSAPTTGPSGTFPNGGQFDSETTNSTGLATARTFTSNNVTGEYTVTVTATKNDANGNPVVVNAGIVMSNGRVKTTTTLSANPASNSVYGQTITLSATVRPLTGTLIPAAPVTFSMGGAPISNCTAVSPSGGVATCTLNPSSATTFLAIGPYNFTANYPGDNVSQPSATALAYTVNAAESNVSLSSDHSAFAVQGDSVILTASVSAASPGRGTPTGNVTFTSSDGTVLNGGHSVALANGSAQISTGALSPGAPQISVAYSGDTDFLSSSAQFTQNVYTVPSVTTNPSSQSIAENTVVFFTAAGTGIPSPTIQWQVSPPGGGAFANIPNATTTTFNFTARLTDDQKQFRAVLTNPAGSVATQPATLTVGVPSISVSNLSATSIAPRSATLNATSTENVATITRQGFEYVAGIYTDAQFNQSVQPVGTLAEQQTFGPPAVVPGDYSIGIRALSPGTTYTYLAFVVDDFVPNLQVFSTVSTFTTAKDQTSLSVNAASGPSGGTTSLSATLTSGTGGLGGKTVNFRLNGTSVGSATTDNSGQAVLSNASLAGIAAGTYSAGVGASFTEDSAYLGSSASGSLTVNPGEQATLSVTGPTSATYGQMLTPTVSGGSGTGALTFSASGTACAIGSGTNAGMLVITAGSGTCSLSATKAGDPNYSQANSAPLAVTVNPAALTVTASSPASVVFDSPAPSITPSYATFVGSDGPAGLITQPACSTPYTLGSDVGTYATVCSGAVSSNYSFSYVPGSFEVTQAQGSVSISNLPASPTVTESFSPRYTALGNGTPSTVSLSAGVCSIDTSGLVTFQHVGVCQLQPSITAGTDYLAATGTAQPVTVGRGATSLTVGSASGTYSETTTLTATLTVGATPVGGKTIGFALNGATAASAATDANGIATLTNVSLAGTNAGNYATAISTTFAGDSDYASTSGTGSLTVNRAQASVSINNLPTGAVAGNSFSPTYTLLGDGTPSTASLTGSTCTVSGSIVNFIAQGTCTLQASITEGTNYLATTGSSQNVSVGPAAKKATSTSLTSSPNPATVGQPVTFTASVSPASSTGSVTFVDGTTAIGTTPLAGTGTAAFTTNSLSAGSHSITAVYGGSSTTSGSTSAAVIQLVNQSTTFSLSVAVVGTGSITSQPAGINCGTTCSASFAPGTSVTLIPQSATGSVFSGWSGDCSGTGTCTVSMSASHSVTATFSAATATRLSSSLSPSTLGQAVTFTAVVTPSGATGTVTFLDGSTPLATQAVVGGTANFTTSALSAASHSITAAYSGAAGFAPSTSSKLTQVVKKLATTTSLASSANPSTVGQPVTLTASVSPSAATGTVTFFDGTTALGTQSLSGGTASLTTSALAAGPHTVTATYNGDASYATSTSAALSQIVSKH